MSTQCKDFGDSHHPHRVHTDNKYWIPALCDKRPSLVSLQQISLEFPQQSACQSGAKATISLPHLKAESIRDFSNMHGITLAGIFDTAWAQILSLYARSSDATFEYVVSGCDGEILSAFDVVGPLPNNIPYHLSRVLSESNSTELSLLAKRPQEQRMDNRLHTHYKIGKIKTKLQRRKLFNTAVNF